LLVRGNYDENLKKSIEYLNLDKFQNDDKQINGNDKVKEKIPKN